MQPDQPPQSPQPFQPIKPIRPNKFGQLSWMTKFSFLGVIVLLGGIGLSVNLAMQTQQSKSSAWYTSQSALGVCDDDGDGDVDLHVSFTNTETNKSLGMNVIAKDITTGQQINLGTIEAQQTKSGVIDIKKSAIANGGVIYYLTWSSGMAGTDQRTAPYTALSCGAPTPAPTIYRPPTPTPTHIPTPTIVPTTVIQSTGGDTTLSLNLYLDGLGKAGDRVKPGNGQGNMNPLRKTRAVTVQVYDSSNTLASTVTGSVTFAASSGSFVGKVDLGNNFKSGLYTVKVVTSQYLRSLVPGIQNLSSGKDNQLPLTSLVVGDVNGDNAVNILDYNILAGCYSDLLPAASCAQGQEAMADFTDDGKVNNFDYNLFLRELTNFEGQ